VAVWTQNKYFPLLTCPQGSQGCQKITFFFHKWNCFPFALRLPPKDTNYKNHQNWIKNVKKTPVFLDFFKYSSIWGQSYYIKPQLACLVDPGAVEWPLIQMTMVKWDHSFTGMVLTDCWAEQVDTTEGYPKIDLFTFKGHDRVLHIEWTYEVGP
jgi:hypothetical protein